MCPSTPAGAKVYWDRCARRTQGNTRCAGGWLCRGEPARISRDPYSTENICIHEFAHAVHADGDCTVVTFDPHWPLPITKSATNRGLWKNTYAATSRHEYWAEGVQS